jgi:hypothetical protein
MSQMNSIQMQIAELEQAMLAAHPRMPLLLKDIHTALKSDPANVTLLTEDEIGIIVAGLKKQTATEITATLMKKKTSLKATSVDDL